MTESSRRAFLAVCGATAFTGCASLGSQSLSTQSDSADWPLFAHDSKNTGYNSHASGPKSSPTERWRVRTHDLREEFRGYALTPSPAIIGDRVYVGGETFSAHDLSDGSVVWESVGEDAYYGTGFADETLFVATWDKSSETSSISAFDTDGNRKWKQKTGSRRGLAPTIGGSTVYAPSDPKLVALDRQNGNRQWETKTVQPYPTQPSVADAVYIPTGWDGCIARSRKQDPLASVLSHPPKKQWTHDPDGIIRTPPAVGSRYVYAAMSGEWHPDVNPKQPRLFALTSGGKVAWSRPAGTISTTPVVGDGVVFEKTGVFVEKVREAGYVRGRFDAKITAHDAEDGEVRWQRTVDGFGSWHIQPVLADKVLYVPLHEEIGRESRLLALDAKTGETLWNHMLDAPTTHLAVAESTLYVTSYDGILHAFE
ncbi:Outer membrane protein assembly factor BamB, contains PQQ-like beta-propeller repeat [Haladaptatus litoreus]|uniref:Outer membrane protein assembly factor BamB, contains PQQ-like beta-propeller repeat n=1 Tax=Haladaptatus litoreus TaxID=553468 RepID=A0A1N6VQ48_9EURY|nr:PQQ-binding-like beta-propeller repeat protein [Haladaptatus litoreus]SIQ79868.1 Outer membrane protein assembly factor BamB, contains PQQ-like beta-propeller repeat [Haladaptatus litoreus]